MATFPFLVDVTMGVEEEFQFKSFITATGCWGVMSICVFLTSFFSGLSCKY